MRELAIDLETRSEQDIKFGGMHRYGLGKFFRIMIFGYQYSDMPEPVCVDLMAGEKVPQEVLDDLPNSRILKTAYNAPFEMWCIEQDFGIELDPTQWECTRIKAAMLGLPLSLDVVAKVLNLPQQKMSEGKALIKLFTMPQTVAAMKKNGGKTWINPEDEPEKWQTFKEYNIQDIKTEVAIRQKIAFFTIPAQEMELWYFDYRMNARGICLDEDFFERAITIYEENQIRMLEETQDITGVDNPNSAAQLKVWLSEMLQTEVTKLTKGEVEAMMKITDHADVLKVLKLRQQIAKSSIKKYFSMRKVICSDGRARGLIQFYGANRTGRFAGRLIQVQNLIKNFLKDLDLARSIVKNNDLSWLELMFGNVPDTLAQLIRTAFVPSEGNIFYIADFSAIEAVVIAWLAGEQWRLDVFNSHGMIYSASASKMFKVLLESITYLDEHGEEQRGPNYYLRAKGKVSELALGFQGGPNALINMGALNMGICDEAIRFGEHELAELLSVRTFIPFKISVDDIKRKRITLWKSAQWYFIMKELQHLVDVWRSENEQIVNLWYSLGNAAIECVRFNKPVRLQYGITFFMSHGVLFVKLPSGRYLSYMRPKIKMNRFGKAGLTYEGLEQKTNTWRTIDIYGGKWAENIVQAIARDCLAVSLLKWDKKGYDIVIHVHDEGVIDAPDKEGTLEDILAIMCEPIDWAPGLPLRAAGYKSAYYKKD